MNRNLRKSIRIRKILENGVYHNDTAIYQKLEKKLSKWSADDLDKLGRLLSHKEAEVIPPKTCWTMWERESDEEPASRVGIFSNESSALIQMHKTFTQLLEDGATWKLSRPAPGHWHIEDENERACYWIEEAKMD